MKGEIDKDFYCSAGKIVMGENLTLIWCSESKKCGNYKCGNYHRKWPTPQQFLEEYGEEYPDDGAVYGLFEPGRSCNNQTKWIVTTLEEAEHNLFLHIHKENIICACTPFGKPSKDWRPE